MGREEEGLRLKPEQVGKVDLPPSRRPLLRLGRWIQ